MGESLDYCKYCVHSEVTIVSSQQGKLECDINGIVDAHHSCQQWMRETGSDDDIGESDD